MQRSLHHHRNHRETRRPRFQRLRKKANSQLMSDTHDSSLSITMAWVHMVEPQDPVQGQEEIRCAGRLGAQADPGLMSMMMIVNEALLMVGRRETCF